MKKSILFTGGGGAGSELIWKKLGNKYKIFFADVNINNINPEIPRINCIKVFKSNSPRSINNLIKICKKQKIDYLVPGIDEELKIILKNKKKFLKTNIFLPDLNFVNLMLDKFKMYDVCKQKKILTPKTYLLNKNFNIKNSKKLIFKPRFGRGSRGIYIGYNNQQISFIEKYIDIMNYKNKESKNYIVQKYIPGTEYTVTVINNINKENQVIFPIKILKKKGITISGQLSMDTSVINFCKKINIRMDYPLVYNVQLIKKKNSLYLIEINPRVSTTFCFLVFSGFDPFSGNFLNKNSLKKKIYLRRYYKNYITYV
tara:strand:+ start:2103 stop:3044 length:942 start_codon:yes stop_codon:yes gene_type:complete